MIKNFHIQNGILKHYNDNGKYHAVIIPDGVTEIASQAFRDCQYVESITIPDSVKMIGYRAFEKCTAMEHIRLPEHLEQITAHMLDDCCNLKSIRFPEFLTSIEKQAFSGCAQLKELHIPEHVEEIGAEAFEHCKALQYIQIPRQSVRIGYGLFNWCMKLKEVTFGDGTVLNLPSLKAGNISVDVQHLIYLLMRTDFTTGEKTPEAVYFNELLEYAGTLIERNDLESLISLEETTHILNADNIDVLIEYAILQERISPEIHLFLTDYKAKYIGFSSISERFQL